MQIPITKLTVDLVNLLNTYEGLRPATPAISHAKGVRAVYQCETKGGASFVTLDVTLGDALFQVRISSLYAMFQTEPAPEHLAMLEKVLILKEFMERRMRSLQPFDDRDPHTLRISRWLHDAGVWLNSLTTSVFR